MSFLQQEWYCAAWSSEISEKPMVRTILNQPVLLYRTDAGAAVAMDDRCAHRFAPLHLGVVKDDAIECPYHGLIYGPDGQCRLNPHGSGAVPPRAKLRTYALMERQGVVWIWTGDPGAADPAEAPDLPELDGANGWTTVAGNLTVGAHVSLIIDNLLDLTHAGYLHPGTVSVPASIAAPEIAVQVQGEDVLSSFISRDVPPSGPFRPHWGEGRCDYHRQMRWTAPSVLKLTVGVCPLGKSLDDGLMQESYHLLTPANDHETHYFWTSSRRYALNDEVYDAAIRAMVNQAFVNEDEPMIAACQRYMGGTDVFALRPALLETDRASVLVNRIVQQRSKRERAMISIRPLPVDGAHTPKP